MLWGLLLLWRPVVYPGEDTPSCHQLPPTVFGTGDQPIGESSSEELGNLRDGQVDVESGNFDGFPLDFPYKSALFGLVM